ncbi:MAG: beta-galactosidase, partial [Gemmatimonadales bacterium]
WGEKFVRTPMADFLGAYDSLISRGVSVNLYMFHGGTNFGFHAGANYTREIPIQPSITSYDYDAPLDEAGHPTPKYLAIREVLARHSKKPLPPVPAAPLVIAIPAVTLAPVATLFDFIDTTHQVKSKRPLSFEELGQSTGYVLYRHHADTAVYGMLEVPGLRDFGLVFVNGRRTAMLDRRTSTFSTVVDVPKGGELAILVENEGRINYGAEMVRNRKGIISSVRLAGEELSGWRMVRLPFSKVPKLPAQNGTAVNGTAVTAVSRRDSTFNGVPTLYRGSFTLDSLGDTFLDLGAWGKGIVFVNGHNLGRYWEIGPQRTLYLPAPWLKKGANDLVVFEQLNDSVPGTVQGLTAAVLDSL